MATKISWANEVWNPITGCTPISEGCQNCYAKKMSQRLKGRFGYPEDDPFKPGIFHPDKIEPYKWRKAKRIVVCSMGDIFHKDVSVSHHGQVYDAMKHNPQHTYILLTKRPEQMKAFFEYRGGPMENWWCGVTAENQEQADKRIPILLQIPAAVHFVSVEPMLEEIDMRKHLHCGLSWIIIGAESGSRKRAFSEDWARRLVIECEKSKVPVFYKQNSDQKMPAIDGVVYDQYPGSINKTNVS